MNDSPKNPPAFPVPAGCANDDPWNGMSLRDYFAAKAIPAVLETSTIDGKPWFETKGQINPKIIAQGCYAVADAMLAHRMGYSK